MVVTEQCKERAIKLVWILHGLLQDAATCLVCSQQLITTSFGAIVIFVASSVIVSKLRR